MLRPRLNNNDDYNDDDDDDSDNDFNDDDDDNNWQAPTRRQCYALLAHCLSHARQTSNWECWQEDTIILVSDRDQGQGRLHTYVIVYVST